MTQSEFDRMLQYLKAFYNGREETLRIFLANLPDEELKNIDHFFTRFLNMLQEYVPLD